VVDVRAEPDAEEMSAVVGTPNRVTGRHDAFLYEPAVDPDEPMETNVIPILRDQRRAAVADDDFRVSVLRVGVSDRCRSKDKHQSK
jgi:hypothetical protein